MHDDRRTVQRPLEKALIGFELERIGHEPSRVSDRAVQARDRIAFDTKGSAHYYSSLVRATRQAINSFKRERLNGLHQAACGMRAFPNRVSSAKLRLVAVLR